MTDQERVGKTEITSIPVFKPNEVENNDEVKIENKDEVELGQKGPVTIPIIASVGKQEPTNEDERSMHNQSVGTVGGITRIGEGADKSVLHFNTRERAAKGKGNFAKVAPIDAESLEAEIVREGIRELPEEHLENSCAPKELKRLKADDEAPVVKSTARPAKLNFW